MYTVALLLFRKTPGREGREEGRKEKRRPKTNPFVCLEL